MVFFFNDNEYLNSIILDRKHCMEWEISAGSAACELSSSETNSSSELNVDADDEQSDWTGAECLKPLKYYKKDLNNEVNLLIQHDKHTCSSLCSTSSDIGQSNFSKNACLNFNASKLVERFLDDAQQKELILYNAYKLSIVCFLLY